VLGNLLLQPNELKSAFVQDMRELDSESKPTSGDNPNWPFPRYKELSSRYLAVVIVMGQDFSFGAYDEDMFVR